MSRARELRAGRSLFAALGCCIVALLSTGAGGTAYAQNEQPGASDQLEVILAFDASESMWPHIRPARAAAHEFVASMPEGVLIGVESFASEVTTLSAPTLDRALIDAQIDSIVPGGETALFDVVVSAGQHFSPTVEHKVIVLVSDGVDDGSTASLDEAIAASQDVHVEAISLGGRDSDVVSLEALGEVTSADDAAAMSAAFARISELIVEVIDTVPAPTTNPPPTTTTTTTIAATTTPPATTPPATTIVATTVAAPAVAASPPASPPSTAPLWLGAIAVFLGLFVLGVLLTPRERVAKARLGVTKPRRSTDIGARTTTAIEDVLDRHGKRDDLGTTLAVADISMKPAEFIATVAFVAVVAGLVALLFVGPIVAVLVAVGLCLSARVYVNVATSKRRAAFADQLPDVVQLVSTALRSGYGITQAIESVAEEAEEPARTEFAHVLVQNRLGRPLSASMQDLAERMQSDDLAWIVAAIDINRDTGGNLSEILDQVGTTIRERGRVARQVRTLTAEGRLSARILTGLPFLMLVWQWRANPENFGLLTSGLGLIALLLAGILMVVGTVWVRKVVSSVAL